MISARSLFYSYLAQTSPKPMELEITGASGVYLHGAKGEQYIDMISGIAVSNVGHCHPKVVEAVQKQSESYMHLMVYGEYVQAPQVQLANKIADSLPAPLDNVYLVNSGSEANEGAMKLAKRHTGRSGIVHCSKSYHGSTQGTLSIIGDKSFKEPFGPLLPGVQSIDYNDESQLSVINEETALVVMETVQAEAGIILPTEQYLKAVRKRCDQVGALLLFDEVQTGFGRTGSLWGMESSGVVPDIVTAAKGMGGGMPIGAFISSKEIMSCLTHHPVLGHITTFGGHPVSSAASLACLEVIEREKLLEQIPSKEQIIKDLLQHDEILELRGKGLMFAVEFKDAQFNFAVIEACVRNGVITDWFLFNDKCLRIAPPLTINEDELSSACGKILQSIDEVVKAQKE